MESKTKFNVWYVFLAIWGVILVHELWVRATQIREIPYSQFRSYLEAGRVEEIRITQNYLAGVLREPKEGETK